VVASDRRLEIRVAAAGDNCHIGLRTDRFLHDEPHHLWEVSDENSDVPQENPRRVTWGAVVCR